jgi:hypothetical protein
MNCKTALEWAKFYTARTWRVVPVPHKTKAPWIPGWEQLRLTEAELPLHFRAGQPQNIGVLLGDPSGCLVDVDLDHSLAVQLAARFLPKTTTVFGRISKPRSHWLFYLSEDAPTRQWRLPHRKKMVVELRSTGAQTVFPGSTHPLGEQIQWDTFGEPARVEPAYLEQCIESLYECVCKSLQVPKATRLSILPADHDLAPQGIVDRARKYLAKMPPAVSGQGGHDATFHAACTLVLGFGLGRTQALTLLSEWNERCDPPWSEKELEHKIDDANKQPGWRGYLLTQSTTVSRPKRCTAIERANRHAIEHRLKQRRRVR